jgi:hypothetical protein
VCGVPRTGASAGRVRRLPPWRLKPRLELHKIRLRGFSGLATFGVPRTGASATRDLRPAPTEVVARGTCGYSPRRRTSRFSSGDFNRSWCGLGGLASSGVPRTGASATGRIRRLRPWRLKPRLELHEIRLRGFGGPVVCGAPRTGASAAGRIRWLHPWRLKPRLQLHEIRLRGLGGPVVCGVPGTGASAAGRIRRLRPGQQHRGGAA